jgi:hypothetical protein
MSPRNMTLVSHKICKGTFPPMLNEKLEGGGDYNNKRSLFKKTCVLEYLRTY